MRGKKLVLSVAMLSLGAAVLGGCSSASTTTEVSSVPEGYWAEQEMDDVRGIVFSTIATSEDGRMELQLNPKTATVRWLDTETGLYQDSNLSNDTNLEKLTNSEKSDLIVSYFNGTDSETYKTYTSYDSFSMSVDRDQIGYQLIDNGVRILYSLGDDSLSYKNFPQDISGDRMQELVLQYLDELQAETLSTNYYTKMSTGEWHRRATKDSPLGKRQVQELYGIFYETGHYTEEELYADLDAHGVDEDEYPSNLLIVVPVEYYLDGNELVVHVDASKLETGPDNPIRNLTLLPYFLSSSTEDTAEDGYMLIPDGSGALIWLDSTKNKESHFTGSWYGGDRLINATTFSSVTADMKMPVLGLKREDRTIFAVIEEGAEAATLDAYVSGTDNSEPFSKMELTFEIRSQQQIQAASEQSYTVYKATDDVYDEDITIRYFWLGEDAGYVEMANCYAQYLEEKGMLTAEEAEEEAPFYVELMGTTDKTQFMLGIPYDGKQVLTSFSEAQSILEELDASGIKNIKLIYSGMTNGGMNQRALTGGVKYAPDLGGSSAFKKLVQKAENLGAEVYPNLYLQTAYTKSGLSGEAVGWNIVNERAQIYTFDPVTMKVSETEKYKRYVINPNYFATYLNKVKNSFTKKTGLTTLASNDLMTFVGTNYKGKQVSVGTGDAIYKEAAASFADGLTLMLSNPMTDAYAYTTYLTDLPTTDSGMRILDASVPFMQMVLDGYKTYSAESLNLESTDIREKFMHAIEANSAPKFTFTYRDSSLLADTEQADLFAVDYSYWKEELADWYQEYAEFYNQVKDANIKSHEVYQKNDKLRVVTYTNGVTVYFNYSDLDEVIDGVKVPAFSYVIEG